MKEQNNVDTTQKLTMVEWCAGYGGIHLGLKRAIRNLRVIAYGEIEAFACANLVAKMEAGLMDAAPLWTDIKTFPCEEFRDRVDILVAGYPCQPFSAAGKRLGTEDPRHLWPHIARAIRVIRPRLCFFENVEGHISLGLSTVVSDLEELGYKVAWGIFSASEVGAPHQRKRVFILGVANGAGERVQGCWAGRLQEPRSYAGQGLSVRGGDAGSLLADPMCDGIGESWLIQQGADGPEPIGNGESWGAWPSRPGEPQHGWEPPRVTTGLANAGGIGRRGRDHGDAGGSSGEIQAPRSCGARREQDMENSNQLRLEEHRLLNAGLFIGSSGRPDTEAMGDADPRRLASGIDTGSGGEASGGGQGDIEQADGGLGDSECVLLPTAGEYGAMDEASGIPADGEGSEPSQACAESSPSRKRESHGSYASERSQTQPSLGGNADGPAGGLDYAELCVSCDNRTDELRLLGNGVVWQTAERAFRVLMEELTK